MKTKIKEFFEEMGFSPDEQEAYEAQIERNVFSYGKDLHEELLAKEFDKIREELE